MTKENTTQLDIKKFGNSNHVFLSLEPGDTPKKRSSDFGQNRLRVSLDHPALQQTASVTPNDLHHPKLRKDVQDKYKANTPKAKDILSSHSKNVGDLFVGKDIVPGLLMTAISDSRKIGPKANKKMMAAQSENDFNEILNGLYRPEIKVPNHLFVKDPSFVNTKSISGSMPPQNLPPSSSLGGGHIPDDDERGSVSSDSEASGYGEIITGGSLSYNLESTNSPSSTDLGGGHHSDDDETESVSSDSDASGYGEIITDGPLSHNFKSTDSPS